VWPSVVRVPSIANGNACFRNVDAIRRVRCCFAVLKDVKPFRLGVDIKVWVFVIKVGVAAAVVSHVRRGAGCTVCRCRYCWLAFSSSSSFSIKAVSMWVEEGYHFRVGRVISPQKDVWDVDWGASTVLSNRHSFDAILA